MERDTYSRFSGCSGWGRFSMKKHNVGVFGLCEPVVSNMSVKSRLLPNLSCLLSGWWGRDRIPDNSLRPGLCHLPEKGGCPRWNDMRKQRNKCENMEMQPGATSHRVFISPGNRVSCPVPARSRYHSRHHSYIPCPCPYPAGLH